MTDLVWPDPRALIDDLAEYFEEAGETLRIRQPDDLAAGIERARLARDYDPDATLCTLAALIFDGVSTRHPLVDGNKRLAWQSAVVFLGLNGLYLDAPEVAAFEIGMAVIRHEQTTDDLARFFEAHVVPLPG